MIVIVPVVASIPGGSLTTLDSNNTLLVEYITVAVVFAPALF